MTTKEMFIEFVRLIGVIDKSVLTTEMPSSSTVLQMLNIAQVRYLKEVYFKDGDYETILLKSENLKNLIVREVLSVEDNTGAMVNYSKSVSLANTTKDLLFYIRSDSKIVRSAMPVIGDYDLGTHAEWMPNDYIKITDKEKYITSPVNKPIIIKPGCYIEKLINTEELKLIILYDSYTKIITTDSVSIEYLKKPEDITFDNDSELPSYLHEEIVKLGVDLYINYYKFRLLGINQSQKQ